MTFLAVEAAVIGELDGGSFSRGCAQIAVNR
jgi:hypothetical protein